VKFESLSIIEINGKERISEKKGDKKISRSFEIGICS